MKEEVIYIKEQKTYLVNGTPVKESQLTEKKKKELATKAKKAVLIKDDSPITEALNG